MTCKTCHDEIVDGRMFCARCVNRRTHMEVLSHQAEFIPAVLTGEMNLRLTRPKPGDPSHLMLYGTGVRYHGTFCGQRFDYPPQKMQTPDYRAVLRDTCCPRCWEVFDEMALRARRDESAEAARA